MTYKDDEDRVEQSSHDGAQGRPNDEGVKRQHPERPNRVPNTGVNYRLDSLERNCRGAGVEHKCTQFEKGNDKDDLQGIYNCIYQLNRGKVETECEGRESTQQGRRTKHRRYAEHDTQSNGQRDLFRRHALTQQLDEGRDQAIL